MKSQFSGVDELSVPWGGDAKKSFKPSFLGRFKSRRLNRQLIYSAFISGIALTLLLIGSLTFANATKKNSPLSTHNQLAVAPSCENSPNGSPFASCPSLNINFANQPDGPLSSQYFNVYSGKPVANNEAELYTGDQQNLRIQKGNLILEALNQPEQGYNYTSARIDTQGKQNFMYGKLEIRATLPDGIGTLPAIWMLSSSEKYKNLGPASNSNIDLNDGEIDIAESVGTEPHVVYGIAHSLAYPPNGPNRNYYSYTTVAGNDSTMHDYGLQWTPTNLTFTIDGKPYYSISKQPNAGYQSWPYDQPYYLILNLALGGNWGGTDTAQFPGSGVDPSALPATMKVQSITYYPYTGK